MSTVTVSFSGSTQKIVPAVPSQPYSPMFDGPPAVEFSSDLDVRKAPAHRSAACRLDGLREAVNRHRLDRLRAQQAYPVELSLVEQHLAEAQIVGHRRQQPDGALDERRTLGERQRLCLDWREAATLGWAVHRGEARALFGRRCQNIVSVMPSGRKMRSSRNVSKGVPDQIRPAVPARSFPRCIDNACPDLPSSGTRTRFAMNCDIVIVLERTCSRR